MALVEKLKITLKKQGPQSLVGNKGFRNFIRLHRETDRIDPAKVKEDARFGGKYVLLTSTDIAAYEVAVTYKRLWQVARAFRDFKSTLEVRPVFHQQCWRVQGHIFCNFLALYLKIALQKQLKIKEIDIPWDQALLDLDAFKAIHLQIA